MISWDDKYLRFGGLPYLLGNMSKDVGRCTSPHGISDVVYNNVSKFASLISNLEGILEKSTLS